VSDAHEPAGDVVRLALRGWEQRVHAVIEIARDSDDLAARLPVLDALAHELVRDLERGIAGLDEARHRADISLPEGSDTLREALGRAHALLHGIGLWHRAPSVSALRKVRDGFAVAADRLAARRG